MDKFNPTAIIATWMNDERTQGYQLQANGDLAVVSRASASDVWSPSTTLPLNKSAEPFAQFVAEHVVFIEVKT